MTKADSEDHAEILGDRGGEAEALVLGEAARVGGRNDIKVGFRDSRQRSHSYKVFGPALGVSSIKRVRLPSPQSWLIREP